LVGADGSSAGELGIAFGPTAVLDPTAIVFGQLTMDVVEASNGHTGFAHEEEFGAILLGESGTQQGGLTDHQSGVRVVVAMVGLDVLFDEGVTKPRFGNLVDLFDEGEEPVAVFVRPKKVGPDLRVCQAMFGEEQETDLVRYHGDCRNKVPGGLQGQSDRKYFSAQGV